MTEVIKKADSLILQMSPFVEWLDDNFETCNKTQIKNAIHCSIVAVNTIINCNPHSNPLNIEIYSTMKFWMDVRQELINRLKAFDMKTLTKEDLPIGTKVVPHDKTASLLSLDNCKQWNIYGGKEQGFLYVTMNKNGCLVLNAKLTQGAGNFYNYSDVTLYEEKPKIKKSDLQERIEALERKVSDLQEIVLKKKTSEIIEKHNIKESVIVDCPPPKQQFEVGKVYKKTESQIIFYCTEINDDVALGFGITYNGRWLDNGTFATQKRRSCFTEATTEEWSARLEEYAKEKGYVKGVRIGNCMNDIVGLIEEDIAYSFFNLSLNEFTLVDCVKAENGLNNNWTIMHNGKWAEIIEEPQFEVVLEAIQKPQYEIGTLGLFWDGDFEEELKKDVVVVLGKLGKITDDGHFIRKGKSVHWDNFKPI